MKPEDKRLIEQHTEANEELARSKAEADETRVYFIAPGYLSKFDRDCGEGANLASVYVIDTHNAPAPGLHLAQGIHEDQTIPPDNAEVIRTAFHAHASMLNFLLVPAGKAHLAAGEPVLIFLMFKSVFTHAGLSPYAHRPAFAHALSRFIDVNVITS